MDKTFCNRCGREITERETDNIALDIYQGFSECPEDVDLCEECAKLFRDFLDGKPVPAGSTQRIMPPKGAMVAREEVNSIGECGDYSLGDLSAMVNVPKTTLRGMLEKAGADSYQDRVEGQQVRLYVMDDATWGRLANLVEAYRPRRTKGAGGAKAAKGSKKTKKGARK